jgi:hypothetical protein
VRSYECRPVPPRDRLTGFPPAPFAAQEGRLAELYQGEWLDYVQCTACLRESAKTSTFGELTLPIRTFADPPVCLESLECASTPRLGTTGTFLTYLHFAARQFENPRPASLALS